MPGDFFGTVYKNKFNLIYVSHHWNVASRVIITDTDN